MRGSCACIASFIAVRYSAVPSSSPLAMSCSWILAVISYMPSSITDTYDVVDSNASAMARRDTSSCACTSASNDLRACTSIRSALCPSMATAIDEPPSAGACASNSCRPAASSARSSLVACTSAGQETRNIWCRRHQPSRDSGTVNTRVGYSLRTAPCQRNAAKGWLHVSVHGAERLTWATPNGRRISGSRDSSIQRVACTWPGA